MYCEGGKYLKREFRFAEDAETAEARPTECAKRQPATSVTLHEMKHPWRDVCPKDLKTIALRIVEHCLPFFLNRDCPAVSLRDESEAIDLNALFTENFGSAISEHLFRVEALNFRLRGLRLYGGNEKRHRLVYAANRREVIAERLDRFLPNLSRMLEDGKGAFSYFGFVEGSYLDERVNDQRTGFTFPTEIPADEDELKIFGPEVVLSHIRDGALSAVRKDLSEYLDALNAAKSQQVKDYIAREGVQYRVLLKDLDTFIDQIPPGISKRALELKLHEKYYEKQLEVKKQSDVLLEGACVAGGKDYLTRLRHFMEQLNEIGKSSLAQYVVHRKIVLEFLEKCLKVNEETGAYEREATIHNMIFPMRKTSEDVPYEQQNLWIIDERLCYHTFLASDQQLKSSPRLSNDSFAEATSKPHKCCRRALFIAGP